MVRGWKVVAAFLFLAPGVGSAAVQPKTMDEWKAFCNAPNLVERLKAIPDKQERENAGSMCARAPWIKSEKSPPKSW